MDVKELREQFKKETGKKKCCASYGMATKSYKDWLENKILHDTAQPEKTKEIRSCATCSLQGDEMYCLKHCIDHSAWERKTVQPEKVEDKTIEIDISQDTWDM